LRTWPLTLQPETSVLEQLGRGASMWGGFLSAIRQDRRFILCRASVSIPLWGGE
jgi:hypothetical protein